MVETSSRQPRRQRKAQFNRPVHRRGMVMVLPLSKELRSRYHRRRLTVRKGDTVRVLAGSFVGREERVARVDRRNRRLVLDNVTLRKADKKLQQLPLNPGHLLLTRLNLSDAWRRRVLHAPEPAPEEEAPTEAATETPSAPTTNAAPAPEKED